MRPAYDRALALTRTAAPARPEDEWPWYAIRDVAVETLLRVVHDLGAPTQARVDAAAALLTASSRNHPTGDD